MNVLDAVIMDRSRVAAAQRLLPIDTARALILGRLVRLAADLAQAPIATVTIVEGDRQVFAAHVGQPEGMVSAGSTPLGYSICQHAVATGRPLIVGDARLDAAFKDNRAVVELGMVAYAGIPLISSERHGVGALCAADVIPRDWTDHELSQLALLADIVTDTLDLA